MYGIDSLKTNLIITHIQKGIITLESNVATELELDIKVKSLDDFIFLSTESHFPVEKEVSLYEILPNGNINLFNAHPAGSVRLYIIFFFIN